MPKSLQGSEMNSKLVSFKQGHSMGSKYQTHKSAAMGLKEFAGEQASGSWQECGAVGQKSPSTYMPSEG